VSARLCFAFCCPMSLPLTGLIPHYQGERVVGHLSGAADLPRLPAARCSHNIVVGCCMFVWRARSFLLILCACQCVCVCVCYFFCRHDAAPSVACMARISLLNLWFSNQTAAAERQHISRQATGQQQLQLRLQLHEYSEKLLNMIMAYATLHGNSPIDSDLHRCSWQLLLAT